MSELSAPPSLIGQEQVSLVSDEGEHVFHLVAVEDKGLLIPDDQEPIELYWSEAFTALALMRCLDRPMKSGQLRTIVSTISPPQNAKISLNLVTEAVSVLANPKFVPFLGRNLVQAGSSSQRVLWLAGNTRDKTPDGPLGKSLHDYAMDNPSTTSAQGSYHRFVRTSEIEFYKPGNRRSYKGEFPKKELEAIPPSHHELAVTTPGVNADVEKIRQKQMIAADDIREELLGLASGHQIDEAALLKSLSGDVVAQTLTERELFKLLKFGAFRMVMTSRGKRYERV